MTIESTPASTAASRTEAGTMVGAIRWMQSRAAAANVICRIRLPRTQSMMVTAACRESAVTDVAVDSLLQLRDLSNLAGVSSILILRPQARFELNCLQQFESSVTLISTIDHFAQAEKLIAHHPRTPTGVFIRLKNSDPGIGIRPGMDALQLAQGVTQLSGVCVQGLLFDSHDGDSALQAAMSTRNLILQSGIDCSALCMQVPADSSLQNGMSATEVVADVDTQSQLVSEATVSCTAEVISRPSLSCVGIAIPDVALIGRSLVLPDIPEATVVGWCNDCCVINATGDAARLTIGDSVTVQSRIRHA